MPIHFVYNEYIKAPIVQTIGAFCIFALNLTTMRYNWILFDADNTLLDFTGASKMAFAEAVKQLDIPHSKDLFDKYKKANHIVWTELENGTIDAITLRKKRFELFLKDIEMDRDPVLFNRLYLDNLVEHSGLLSGARQLLNHLHGKTKLGLITNGLKEVQRPRLAHTKIDHYFDVIVISDEIGVSKPDRAYFDYTFKEMGLPPKENVLVVGDNLNSDIKGGMDYGLDTCWFNPHAQTNESGIAPTHHAQDFDEILKILEL